MGTIRSHRDLEAWQYAMDTVVETYRITENFPVSEMYGLRSQMRRAAVSVPSNIAEGQARPVAAAANHCSIALGSLAELDTQVEAAVRLRFLSEDRTREFRRLHESTTRLVAGLRRSKLSQTGAAATGVFLLGLAIGMLG